MKYKFCQVHGVEVHVQNEPDPIATEEDLRRRFNYTYPNPRRNTQGTRIRQNSGRNWFHFGIPAPTDTEGRFQSCRAGFWGKINEHAEIERVSIWSGGIPSPRRLEAYDHWLPDVTPGDFQVGFEILREFTGPLVISIRVRFEPGGDITFGGAVARFDEKED